MIAGLTAIRALAILVSGPLFGAPKPTSRLTLKTADVLCLRVSECPHRIIEARFCARQRRIVPRHPWPAGTTIESYIRRETGGIHTGRPCTPRRARLGNGRRRREDSTAKGGVKRSVSPAPAPAAASMRFRFRMLLTTAVFMTTSSLAPLQYEAGEI